MHALPSWVSRRGRVLLMLTHPPVSVVSWISLIVIQGRVDKVHTSDVTLAVVLKIAGKDSVPLAAS